MSRDLGRRPALALLALATAIGAAFRFYNLDWGAPYFHFHMDEHYVFMGADLLRRDPQQAAMSGKFFMYSTGPMYALNYIRAAYEWVTGAALDLTSQRDQITYMVLGRSWSAVLGTLTVPIVYLAAARAAGRRAGVIAAFLLACAVLHLRESHFFSVDASLTFFGAIALYFLIRTVQQGDWRSRVGSGLAFGLGVGSKYTAAFLAPLIGIAQLLAPDAPRTLTPLSAWLKPAARAVAIGVLGLVTFLIVDPLVVQYFDKFRSDLRVWVTDPLLGNRNPGIYFAHFNTIGSPRLYWFTNLLWWGVGPAFEAASLAAIAWLVSRRDRVALMVAAFPIVFWLVAGRSVAPFMRYAVPLAPMLAVAVGVAAAGWLQHPNRAARRAAAAALVLVLVTTAGWAVAYMNIYIARDARVVASRWLADNVPHNSAVLFEPTHNLPPMGSYRSSVDFYGDHVIWGSFAHPRGEAERFDYYRLYALDTYRYLYRTDLSDDDRRNYINSRLALVDWIVMDDTYTQWYEALDADEYGVVKQYYRDLFAGRLGFELAETFKVYPSLLGWTINDDSAELSFRLFDHPRIFVFRRAS
jgi:hypothetical protein